MKSAKVIEFPLDRVRKTKATIHSTLNDMVHDEGITADTPGLTKLESLALEIREAFNSYKCNGDEPIRPK